MEVLANSITDFYMKRNYVSEENREIYCYGFKLIIADIINFSIVILLGAILHRVLESIVFLVTLCGVRQFSGGFHAKSFWLCRLSMIITFVSVMIISQMLVRNSSILQISLVINVICLVLMAGLAPVKHPNKALSAEQKRKNKIKAVITTLILSIISGILVSFKINKGVTISITLAAVIVLMIIGIIMQKGGTKNV